MREVYLVKRNGLYWTGKENTAHGYWSPDRADAFEYPKLFWARTIHQWRPGIEIVVAKPIRKVRV